MSRDDGVADRERILEQMVRMERDLSARTEREEAAIEGRDGVVLKRLSFLLRNVRARIRKAREDIAQRGAIN